MARPADRSKSAWYPVVSPDKSGAARPSRADDIVALIIVAAYCGLQIWLWATHVPWRDEAQAWLQATAPTDLVRLLILPGEGHPPLWFWLLRGLSLFLDFDQARFISPLIATVNSVLLYRLLRGRVLLLCMLLFSLTLTQYWGYHFRPYGLVLLCMLSALLLDRHGRPIAATWLMAVACGLHFFAGFLMAIWLFVQWQRGTRTVSLLAPALLALAFGILAILSGMGNAEAGPMLPSLLDGTLYNLAWIATSDAGRHPLLALATLALLAFALRDKPLLLALLVGLLVTFAVATAAVYGKYLWHAAFMTMMCLLAFMMAGLNRARAIVLAVLLAPQLLFGVSEAAIRLRNPDTSQPDLVAVARQNAEAGIEVDEKIVAWPDFVGLRFAATHDIQVISGFDGALLGPIAWRDRDASRTTATLTSQATPFWLLCQQCQQVIAPLENAGRTATHLATSTTEDDGSTKLYRID
jgi:hypothetical protein